MGDFGIILVVAISTFVIVPAVFIFQYVAVSNSDVDLTGQHFCTGFNLTYDHFEKDSINGITFVCTEPDQKVDTLGKLSSIGKRR
jgi:hypothetical protein